MFEGLVHQLLIGYLGNYLKNIHKDHLRIGLWNGEVLLENVELILEAFDYLQLPFAIKKGVVGKLSIKIPWKKFGWERILIALEDVYICTCRRNDSEWGAEAVEAREWAGKRAKLAAAELAKLSRRVCDNQAGQSYVSYISAKIIDNIQVTIKNVHIRYVDHNPDTQVLLSFGLRFSSLKINTGTADARAFNSSARSTAGEKSKGGQVHKHVDIHDIGLYWNSTEKYSNMDLFSDPPPDIADSNYILKPLHVTLSLMVSKSGRFESGSPQYVVSLDIDDLVLTLDDIQIYQMLMVWYDFSICKLREKYGRFRPWSLPASNRTGVGWQRHWWKYAVDAVLSDVRKKMRCVSWNHFESRMATRRKYIRIYRLKLEHLQQDQHLDDDNLHELEEIEKELDMDEILKFRSIAESYLQIKDMSVKESGLESESDSKESILEKQQGEERAASRPRRWLNWLSLGMLGAGGTADSSQFAGVISDDIIEDIYEATMYNPDSILDGGSVSKGHCHLLFIIIVARQVMAKLNSMSKKTTIMCMTICGASMKSSIFQDSAHLSITFSSMEIADPFTNHLPFSYVLRDKASADSNVATLPENKSAESRVQFVTIEVEMLPQGSDTDLSVRVMIQPFEFVYNEIILENIIDFLDMPTSFQSHLDRVLSSLNAFENVESRVLYKAECIFSNRNRIFIDANFCNAVIIFPWQNTESSWSKMVFSMESVHLGSLLGESVSREKFELEKFRALAKNLAHNSIVDKEDDSAVLRNFYDCFEIKLDGVKGRLESPMILSDIAFIEFDASATTYICNLQDEPALKQLKVHGNSASMHIILSYSILKAFKDIGANLLFKHHKSKNAHMKVFPRIESMPQNCKMRDSTSDLQSSLLKRQMCPSDMHKVVQYEAIFGFKSASIELSFDEEDQILHEKLTLHAHIENFHVESVQEESGCNFRIGIEKIDVHGITSANPLFNVLHTKNFESTASTILTTDTSCHFNLSSASSYKELESGSEGKCFHVLHFQRRKNGLGKHTMKIYLNNLEFHFHPKLFLQIHKLISLIGHEYSSFGIKNTESTPLCEVRNKEALKQLESTIKYPNLDESFTDDLGISCDHFPFVSFEFSGVSTNPDKQMMTDSFSCKKHVSAFDNAIHSEYTPNYSHLSGRNEKVSVQTAEVMDIDADSDRTNIFDNYEVQIELETNRTDIHFHDSACILTTLMICKSKSFIFLSEENDLYDLMGSFEDIKLLSSWAQPPYDDILLGSLVQGPCPILNLRLRKYLPITGLPELELSISIQHVRCVLFSDFLAIIIGYFSSDWDPSADKESNLCEKEENLQHESMSLHILYKVEVMDSVIILPVETNYEFLEIGVPQLFFCFLPSCTNPTNNVNMHNEGVSTAHFGSSKLNLIDITSRQLSLSFAKMNNVDIHKGECHVNLDFPDFPLIEGLDAALSVRIPCEMQGSCESAVAPVSIIFKGQSLVANILEKAFVGGLQAVENVALELSAVGTKSQFFGASVSDFMDAKLKFKHSNTGTSGVSNATFVDMKFNMSRISLKLHSSKGQVPNDLEPIGNLDLEQIKLSCFWRNNCLEALAMDMFSVRLISRIGSAALLECISTDSSHPAISLHLLTLEMGFFGGSLSIPCANIWVYLAAWREVAVFASTCIYSQSEIREDSPSTHSDVGSNGAGNYKDETLVRRKKLDGNSPGSSGTFHLKSESFNIFFHIPDFSCEDDVKVSAQNVSLEQNVYQDVSSTRLDDMKKNYVGYEKHFHRFLFLSFSAVLDELVVTGQGWTFEARILQIEGKTEIFQERFPHSLPIFHIADIAVKGNINENHLGKLKMVLDLQIDKIDIWSSYPALCFLYNFKFGNSLEGSSAPLEFKLDLTVGVQKAAFLLSDGRWSCNAPIVEIFIRNICICTTWNGGTVEASFSSEMQINYHNIHKVAWEPFVEPWSIHCQFVRKIGSEGLLNTSPTTNIDVKSSSVNFNLTEALMQAVVRGIEMVQDIKHGKRSGEHPGNHHNDEYSLLSNTHIRRYAPYFLQNDTGMPLNFWLIHGPIFSESSETMDGTVRSAVEAGFSVPLFVEETPEELFQRWRPNYSSERLADRKTLGTHHHMICVQLEGTSVASMPMSMDLVGLRSFQVDFSKKYRTAKKHEEKHLSSGNGKQEEIANDIESNMKFILPVVFEVSMQRYSKLVRLYSTVTLVNATSVSLEVRFDIPFGIAPKVMDPILPGQELPLPVHLAETGQMRWRPLGSSYLWSEAQSLANILSQENKLSLLRSFVCYPSHPSNGPFRCCISVQENAIRCYDGLEDQSTGKHFNGNGPTDSRFASKKTSTSSIRRITLTAPLVVKNCLPVCLELSIEIGAGVMEHVFVSEGDAVSVFDIDFVHELGIEIHVTGFSPSFLKFSRATVYTEAGGMTVSRAEKILLTETLILSPDTSKGLPVLVRVEKTVDPLCGSRELSLSVPFWIYNCSGIMLEVGDGDMDQKVDENILYPIYSSIRQEELTNHQSGVGISCLDLLTTEGIENGNTFKEGIYCPNRHLPSKIRSHLPYHRSVSKSNKFPQSSSVVFSSVSSFKETHEWERRGNSFLFSHINDVNVELDGRGVSKIPKAQASMYSPAKGLQAAGPTLRLRLSQSKFVNQMEESVWSDLFPLNPPSGSSMVVIPQPFSSGAFIISAISSPVLGSCEGRTMAITFQPRYVISNACSQDVCYKQRGTNSFQRLKVGEHFNLHCTDVKRELLVSIRFDEPGWDWSGSFLPHKLGDTQVKVRNYVTGALKMVRVEVQNASIAVGEGRGINDSDGSLGTYLVLLSDDDTGFMPYRIDNFSMEILRFYQQKCEKFENILQPYASCAYAWDEPCHPQQLTIEVPGKGSLGFYGLDDVRNHMPVRLKTPSEKSEMRFFVSVHAEGPIKVLSVTSADTHFFESSDVKGSYKRGEKHTADHSVEKDMEFSEKITVCLPFIGLAMVDSLPQELAFASVRGVKIQISQGLHRQKVFLQVASFQIDNQLPHPVYPVLVSIDDSSSGALAIQRNIKENLFDSKVEESAVGTDEVSQDAAFALSIVKWRCKGTSVNCFECVSARFAPLRLEFEDLMVLRLVDFIKSVTWIYRRGTIQTQKFEMWPLNCGMNQFKDNFADPQNVEFIKNPHSSQLQFLKVMKIMENHRSWPSPAAVRPIGAPWQSISLLARRKKKVYIEIFHVAPIKLTISFSSSPWLPKDDRKAAAQSLIWISSTTLQRGLMALMDVEGAPVYFRELTLAHPLASWDAIQGMAVRHYTRQLLHEVYKVLGSVGVFGNPMGFARDLGFGIRDFISVPAKSIVQNPTGLAASMAQGTRSLLNNTVFAVSNAATQFSKVARKGVAAFAFDDEFVEEMERRHHRQGYHNQGVLNEFLEGLTGLLQSPIRGAEKHGLPGILLGIAAGAAGLVARPVVSILEVSGRTAQSIRNRSNPRQLNRFRVRLPRPVIRDSPLRPYSWEEAVGTAVLQEVEGNRLKDEVFVTCIALGMPGTFIVVTERLLLKATNASLAAAALNEDVIPAGPDWDIHLEIALNDILHFDREGRLVNVLAGISETHFKRPKDPRISKQNHLTQFLPFTQESIEFPDEPVADMFLHLLQALVNELRENPSRQIISRHNLR